MSRKNTPSSIDRLPEEIRESIGQLLIQGRTIDEIHQHLKLLNVEVSRSALGRHTKSLHAMMEQIKLGREMANALATKVSDQPDDKLGRLNMELMQGIMLRLITATEEGEDGEAVSVTFGPKDVNLLAGAMKDLAAAQKTDQERYLKAKQEALKEAAAALKSVAKAEGMSADLADKLYEAVVLRGAAQ